jgi:hypothetical protein
MTPIHIRRFLAGATLVASIAMYPYLGAAQSFTGGFNFALPAIDTFSVSFLPSFPKRAIGSQEYVTVGAGGHFYVGSEPLRFFGTNCVADGAFPPLDEVRFIAGRLRKMGYNLVRLHHLDNGWTSTGSLFGNQIDTRHLNPANLDRLERFLAELKANGIYADVNLHVGRTFTRADGVPDADSLLDFGKGYTFFDPLLIALQKEYARQLLRHVNPYTGIPLADDPVMAMVEVTNENSLYALWRNDKLKTYAAGGILPVRHQRLLDSLWGTFLRQRYGTTDALASSWNSGALAAGEELTTNGSFESEPFPGLWALEQHSPAAATATRVVGNVYDGALAVKISVTSATGTDWHVQWKHTGLSIASDTTYVVHFAARADSIRKMALSITKDVDPYTWYAGTECQLDTTWRLFMLAFRARATSTHDVRLSFSVGAAKGVYWVDAVSMRRAGNSGLLAGESLEQTPRRIGFGECANFTDGRVRDMTAFYMALQSDFYTTMKSFLVDSLGVRVPIVGTNWNFGTPDLAVQSSLDYMDNHAYWDHPGFPSIPWSATDWTISNQPMVQQADGGTIGTLMGGDPILDKPYTISEYNHPFPNRYLSEGPLMLTAYAAFHAVDGIMFFGYNGGTDWRSDFVSGYFEMHRNTAQMAQMPGLAAAFRRGLISPATQTLALRLTTDDVLLAPKHDGGSWVGTNLVPGALSLIHAVRTETFHAAVSNLISLPSAGAAPFVSDTKELTWDPRGVFSVSAPEFSAVTGLPQRLAGVDAGAMSIMSSSDHATITWLALDGKSLGESRRSLLTVATRVQNTGMLWDGATTIHNNWGTGPTLVSPLNAMLRLRVQADSLRLSPLTVLGGAGPAARIIYPSAANAFTVSIDQSADKTPWYGIEPMGSGVPTEVTELAAAPTRFCLEQNYPNPFNPSTHIVYRVSGEKTGSRVSGLGSRWVKLAVYDVLGREVAVLVDGPKDPGEYSVQFDGSALGSGVYYYRLEVGGFVATRAMVLTK